MNKYPSALVSLILGISLLWVPAQADDGLTVSNTNGDTSAGSLGSVLLNAGNDPTVSDTVAFSPLFNSPQSITSPYGPFPTVAKLAGEFFDLTAPANLTINAGGAGAFTFTGGGNFSLGNLTIWGGGPYNPAISVFGSTLSLTNVSLPSIGLTDSTLVTTTGMNTQASVLLQGTDTLTVAAGQTSTFTGVISGTGTLVTGGTGTLVLSTMDPGNTYSGGTQIQRGTLQVSQPYVNFSPLGTGPVAIDSQGTLAIASTGFAQTGTLTAGGGTLNLGSAQTVTFSALSRSAGGGLTIIPSGTVTLGSFLQKLGFTAAPTVTNGIVDASIVVATSATDTSADFLNYSPTSGLVRATYSSAVQITNGVTNGTTSTSVFHATKTTNNSVTAPTTLYALKVDSGVIVGGSPLTLGDGTHTAGLILNGGTAASPTTVFDTVNFATGSEGAVYVGGNGSSVYATIQTVTGSNGLTLNGNGYLELMHSNYTGGTTINGGTLQVDDAGPDTPGGSLNPLSLGGTIVYRGNSIMNVSLINDATIDAQPGTALNVFAPINGNGHALSLGSSTETGTIFLNVTPTDISALNVLGGTVTLNDSIWSPVAPINLASNSATLLLEPAANVSNAINMAGGTLESYGTTIIGPVTVGDGPSTINSIKVAQSYSFLTLSGALKGNGLLLTQGQGKVSLTGSSPNFTGQIQSSAANLDITGTLPNGQVSLGAASSNALLSGTGTVGLLLVSSGGQVQPGESGSIGTLTASGLQWDSDGTPQLQFQLSNSSDASSLLDLGSGAFSKESGSTFAFDFLGTGAPGHEYDLINFGAGNTNFVLSDFTATNLAPGLGGTFEFVIDGDTESLVIDVVPEPGTNALIVAGLLGLAAFARRQTRQR